MHHDRSPKAQRRARVEVDRCETCGERARFRVVSPDERLAHAYCAEHATPWIVRAYVRAGLHLEAQP